MLARRRSAPRRPCRRRSPRPRRRRRRSGAGACGRCGCRRAADGSRASAALPSGPRPDEPRAGDVVRLGVARHHHQLAAAVHVVPVFLVGAARIGAVVDVGRPALRSSVAIDGRITRRVAAIDELARGRAGRRRGRGSASDSPLGNPTTSSFEAPARRSRAGLEGRSTYCTASCVRASRLRFAERLSMREAGELPIGPAHSMQPRRGAGARSRRWGGPRGSARA